MSQFERGTPMVGIDRSTAPTVGRQGIQETPNAPGLTVTPPVSPGAQKAHQFLAAVGMVGQFASSVGHIAEKETREAEQLYRGQASLDARTALPGFMQQIENHELLVPDGVKVEDFARQFVDEQIADMPEAYAEQYRQILAPQLAAAFTAQQRGMIQQARDENLQLVAESAIQSRDVVGIKAALLVSQEIAPNLSASERLDRVVVPALRSAAAAGDPERFNAAVEALGGRFPGLVESARLELAENVRSRQTTLAREQTDEFRNLLSGMLDRDQPNFDAAREFVDKAPIPDSLKLSAKDDIDRRESRLFNDLRSGIAKKEKADAQALMLDLAESHMLEAGTNGGAATLPDLQVTGSMGDVYNLSREQAAEQVTDRVMRRFLEESETPEIALARQAEFGSRNGVTWDVYKRTMEAGAMAAMADLSRIADSGDPAALPANLANGYDLYKRIGAMNPEWRNAHIKNEAVGNFYRDAEIAETRITDGDPAAALMIAARARARREQIGGPAAQINHAALTEALATATTHDPWFGWEVVAKNQSDIGGKLRSTARVYMEAFGISAEAAVAEALTDIQRTHTMVNGWLVDTHNRLAPPNLGEIATVVAEDYARQYGEDEGIDVDDLTLIPGETDASWILFNTATSTPVERWRQAGVFTNTDLRRISAEAEQAMEQKAAQQAIEQQERQARIRRGEITVGEFVTSIPGGVAGAFAEKGQILATAGGRIDYTPAKEGLQEALTVAYRRIKETPGAVSGFVADKARGIGQVLADAWNAPLTPQKGNDR